VDGEQESLALLAASLSEGAGEILIARLGAADRTVEHKSSVTDIATDADKASEEYIVGRLQKERPGDGIVAEEGHRIAGASRIVWVIDPLDGTSNYFYGLPVFGVSVAACLADGGGGLASVIAGAIHDPVHAETFSAARGAGAFLNRARLVRARMTPLDQALVGTGFSHGSGDRAVEGRWIGDLLPAIGDLRRSGAAAMDLCSVAAGRLDAFFQQGIKPWDWAAGMLIANEAGAYAGQLLSADGRWDVTVACEAALARPFVSFLERAAGTHFTLDNHIGLG
jgi:myo-inositol-1(or 4)-monophosphatase